MTELWPSKPLPPVINILRALSLTRSVVGCCTSLIATVKIHSMMMGRSFEHRQRSTSKLSADT